MLLSAVLSQIITIGYDEQVFKNTINSLKINIYRFQEK